MLSAIYKDLTSAEEVRRLVSLVSSVAGEQLITVTEPARLQNEIIPCLQFNASVSEREEVKQAAIHWINEMARVLNITAGSNIDFYNAKQAGEHQFFTVPAVNARMATFHTVRSAVRAADALGLPHIVFELALSEAGYTAQQKNEYVALVKAACISLGIKDRVVYLQADHYQLDPKKYGTDPLKEMRHMKDAIVKAIENGVYNVDIDCSKFETDDPNQSDRQNQAENARLTAELFHFIRQYESEHALPDVISIGGEVGEVGGENTKYPQVNAFLELFYEQVKQLGSGSERGLSKIAINVGSAHGGVLGPDGEPLASVPIDFTAHHDVYMFGKDPMNPGRRVISVQHGASTLPKHYFALFPAMHVAEVHLATGFQNLVWDVLEREDAALFDKMKNLVYTKFADKVAAHQTEAVGFMKERKRVTEFVKRDLLLSRALPMIEQELEKEFATIFNSLYNVLQPARGQAQAGDRAD